jgi:hypothetical protein
MSDSKYSIKMGDMRKGGCELRRCFENFYFFATGKVFSFAFFFCESDQMCFLHFVVCSCQTDGDDDFILELFTFFTSSYLNHLPLVSLLRSIYIKRQQKIFFNMIKSEPFVLQISLTISRG